MQLCKKMKYRHPISKYDTVTWLGGVGTNVALPTCLHEYMEPYTYGCEYDIWGENIVFHMLLS